jgi:hypothetical protein
MNGNARSNIMVDLIRLMVYHNVETFYAQVSPEEEGDQYHSDFALVTHNNRNIVMQWVNTGRHNRVTECIFHDLKQEDDQRFEVRWKALEHRAINMTELARKLGADDKNPRDTAEIRGSGRSSGRLQAGPHSPDRDPEGNPHEVPAGAGMPGPGTAVPATEILAAE